MISKTFNLDVNELHTLNKFIHGIISKEDFYVNLILEEVFVNIVDYSKGNFVKVNVKYEDHTLTVEFIDDGVEFNPLLEKDPEAPDSIEDAKIGGLGIFLTKQMADDISYEYINGENHLKLTKKLK